MDDHEKLFIDFFKRKSSFPYSPEFIQIKQTHISILCIAPPYAFKAKKNIRLDFLDYSTIDKRKALLLKELTLNQRLCKKTYLEILPVYKSKNKLTFRPSGPIYDHVLKMNYLLPEFNFHEILKTKSFKGANLKSLSDYLFKFYLGQPEIKSLPLVKKSLNTIKSNINEIYNDTDIFKLWKLKVLKFYTNNFIKNNFNSFIKRMQKGYYRDCHGDLRLEHIYINKTNICIYDTIEFNDSFRQIDILCDLSFLGMELDYYSYHNTEKRFIEIISSDYPDIFNRKIYIFYKIYRSLVRAKVNSIISREDEINKKDRVNSVKKANDFLMLALRYLISSGSPFLIVIMGKTATGKSTISMELSKSIGAELFSTDEIRKTMGQVELYKPTPGSLKKKLYSPSFSDKVYNQLINNSLRELRKNHIAVMDGTFSKKKYRENLLKKIKDSIIFIELNAQNSVTEKRLKDREGKKVVSDARIEDKNLIDSLYESPDEIPENQIIKIKNNKPIDNILEEIFTKIIKR